MPTREEQLALAQAELEMRRRQSQSQQEEQKPSFKERAAQVYRGAGQLAAEFNTGVAALLPRPIGDAIYGVGTSRAAAFPQGSAPSSPVGAGMRYAGTALPLAVGAVSAGTNIASTAMSRPGIFRSILKDISETAMRSPGIFYGSEAAGAFGAGALGEAVRQDGGGPIAQTGAEIVGGLTLGGATSAIPRSIRSGREAILTNLLPMTEEGGMIRAARQTQARAGGAESAEALAPRLENVPEGVTPAQWIGDERLMAQEARLLADNPEMSNIVRRDLQEARLAAQNALRDEFGAPRSRQDWERVVLESVAPEGSVISAGQSDEMLNQAYESFAPLYDSAKGFAAPSAGLRDELVGAAQDEAVLATPQERRAITGWLNNQVRAFTDKMTANELTTDDLLELRSRIRDERRLQSRRGNMERADLLGSAEGEVTARLEQSLPEDVLTTLRATDSQYRKYKVVESALYNAGDQTLTPDQLSQAIRMGGLTSQSRYARGVDEATQEMRRLAMGGRSTEEILGDPVRASLFVRNLSDTDKRAVQADFVNTLITRAQGQSVGSTDGGVPFISGQKLIQDLRDNRGVMTNLGMSQSEISRLNTMARDIRTMEQKSPAAVAQLFEDGPATVMQLAAALIGAKSGQRAAGNGLGSSLVLAQFMSNRARTALANLTSDEAARIMRDAATDPDLYRALLTKDVTDRPELRQRAQYLESWLLASLAEKATIEEQ